MKETPRQCCVRFQEASLSSLNHHEAPVEIGWSGGWGLLGGHPRSHRCRCWGGGCQIISTRRINDNFENKESWDSRTAVFIAAGPTRCRSRDLCSLFALATAPPAHHHPPVIFVDIYSWICFAWRSCIWLGRPPTTGPAGRPPGQFWRTRTESRSSAHFWKTSPEIFLRSIIHSAGGGGWWG